MEKKKQQPRNELHERKKPSHNKIEHPNCVKLEQYKIKAWKQKTKSVWVLNWISNAKNKTEKNIIKNTTIKSIKQKNEKIEEKSNLNLTPHTTVFHQFPIEAMIGPGTELALKQYSVFQEINSFKCLSLLYLSALLRGVATNMVCATPSVSSSIRRFYACNAPPLPPSPPQIPSSS